MAADARAPSLANSSAPSLSALFQRLRTLEPTSVEYTQTLTSALYDERYTEFATNLNEDEALIVIDLLDNALDNIPKETELYRGKALRALRRLCGQKRLIPTSHTLSDGLSRSGNIAVASGTFADVWNGTYNNKQVAIKALRVYNADDLRLVQKLLCKEVVIWKRLIHPNILPFLGVSTTVFRLCIVSEWMASGNINMYLAKNPDANRVNLSFDVASGLQFLHASDVVHGNLKGHNILINDDGRALLADFGFASITKDPLSINASTGRGLHGSARWMAPELLNPDQGDQETPNHPTEASDIYAFAMVNIEIFSGDMPFRDLRNQAVIFRVMAGERPARPANALELGLSDQIWSVIQIWWHQDPSSRTNMSDVLQNLKRIVGNDTREENTPKNDEAKVPNGKEAGPDLVTGEELVLGVDINNVEVPRIPDPSPKIPDLSPKSPDPSPRTKIIDGARDMSGVHQSYGRDSHGSGCKCIIQ